MSCELDGMSTIVVVLKTQELHAVIPYIVILSEFIVRVTAHIPKALQNKTENNPFRICKIAKRVETESTVDCVFVDTVGFRNDAT